MTPNHEQRGGQNCANGIFSALVLAAGVTVSALVGVSFHQISQLIQQAETDPNVQPFDGQDYAYVFDLPVWAIGFAYIVPGLLGVISTCVKSKGVYITTMVFSIITLVFMGALSILSIVAISLVGGLDANNCAFSGNICNCGDVTISGASCDELTRLFAMGVSTMVVGGLGWVFTLVTTILSGILACRQTNHFQGMIVQSMPPPYMTYSVANNDQATLVKNMHM